MEYSVHSGFETLALSPRNTEKLKLVVDERINASLLVTYSGTWESLQVEVIASPYSSLTLMLKNDGSEPSIAMLDEIDSGLDVDALKIVAEAVAAMQREQNMGLVIVSHYARFYELLKPTHAHVLVDGRIVVSGGSELVEKIDQQGYDWIEQEYDVQVVREEEKKVELLGSCGASRGA